MSFESSIKSFNGGFGGKNKNAKVREIPQEFSDIENPFDIPDDFGKIENPFDIPETSNIKEKKVFIGTVDEVQQQLVKFNEQKAFEKKLEEEELKKKELEKLEEIKGKVFRPLGYKGEKNIVWSYFRQGLFELSAKDFTRPNVKNLFGYSNLCEAYPNRDKDGLKVEGYNHDQFCDEVSTKCIKAGTFNIEDYVGYGIFTDPFNKDHLIVNTEKIWGTNPEFNGQRVFGKKIFANDKDLDLSPNDKIATQEDFKNWYDFLGTWNYSRGRQDQDLIFGWSIVAPLAGCVNWRTHFSLTGAQGTGKSTLQECLERYFGALGEKVDGESSEAGIRQKVGASSGVVLIDESESDGTKIASTLRFLRTASSGGSVLRGTADQSGKGFTLKLCGMIGGIVPPMLNPADLSRYLCIEMLQKGEKVHPLFKDQDKQSEIGKGSIMFMIKNYKMFKNVCKLVRIELLKQYDVSRYADTFTTLIAAAYIGLNMDCDEAKIAEYVKTFDFTKERTQMETKDHDNLLEHILKATIKTDKATGTVIELINDIFSIHTEESDKREFARGLGRNGLKVDKLANTYKLYIATKDVNLIKLLRNTKFSNGNLTSVLTRLTNAQLEKDSVSIGGVRSPRSSVVVVDLNVNDYNFDNIPKPAPKPETKPGE